MKLTLKSLLALLPWFGLVALPAYAASLADFSALANDLSNSRQFYSVYVRGNGEAVVAARLIIDNASSEPLTSYIIQPDVKRVSGTPSFIQEDRHCAADKFCNPNLKEDFTQVAAPGVQVQRSVIEASPAADGSYRLKLAYPIMPKSQGAIMVLFRSFDYGGWPFLGRRSFEFKTFKMDHALAQVEVTMFADDSLYTKIDTGESQVNYVLKAEDFLVGSNVQSAAAPALDSANQGLGMSESSSAVYGAPAADLGLAMGMSSASYGGSYGYHRSYPSYTYESKPSPYVKGGSIVKTAKMLSPGETLSVTLAAATTVAGLMWPTIAWVIVILALLSLAGVYAHRKYKQWRLAHPLPEAKPEPVPARAPAPSPVAAAKHTTKVVEAPREEQPSEERVTGGDPRPTVFGMSVYLYSFLHMFVAVLICYLLPIITNVAGSIIPELQPLGLLVGFAAFVAAVIGPSIYWGSRRGSQSGWSEVGMAVLWFILGVVFIGIMTNGSGRSRMNY